MASAGGYHFIIPTKKINTQTELAAFHRSPTYRALLGYIQKLGDKVNAIPNSVEYSISDKVKLIIEILHEMEVWIDEIPPIPQPMRYGNKAARSWHKRLEEKATTLHERILPPELYPAIVEIAPYLLDAFGNSTRLDYGTGHELHFIAWLYCFGAVGILQAEDDLAIVTKIFPAYLNLVRKLQKVYGLEPAGSHGVWSLDDYQFLPFVWGAAQLINHPTIKPADGINPSIAEKYGDEYLYLGCIKFINSVKKGPFHEHSPDLFNISAAASWAKIYTGMLRKFHDDVTAKVPIMQHFLFGSILPFGGV